MSIKSTLLSAALIAGGILLLAGASAPLLGFDEHTALWLLAPGGVLFALSQVLSPLPVSNPVIRRLRLQQLLGALLLVVSPVLLYTHLHAIPPFRGGEWKIALILAAVFEIYTAFRLPAETDKAMRGKDSAE
ncbi:MAG: hypothetical protein IJ553_02290 [Alloprevotella sp.]|nr:hypothetical protein [Alloprevotella sp.]